LLTSYLKEFPGKDITNTKVIVNGMPAYLRKVEWHYYKDNTLDTKSTMFLVSWKNPKSTGSIYTSIYNCIDQIYIIVDDRIKQI